MKHWDYADEPDELDVEYVEDDLKRLEVERDRNDQRFKSQLEHIFDKYGHDFTGIGDEIDVLTGEVVVNNGHLQTIHNEEGSDTYPSSQLLKSFGQDFETQDSEYERDEASEHAEAQARRHDVIEESSQEDDAEDLDERTSDLDEDTDSTGKTVALKTFNTLARPAPRLAHLLVDQDKKLRKAEIVGDHARGRQRPDMNMKEPTSPPKRAPQVSSLQDTFTSFKSRSSRGELDADAIQALGMSIATGLAQMLSGSPSTKRKRSIERPAVHDKAWWYPEPGRESPENQGRPPTRPLTRRQKSLPEKRSAGPAVTEFPRRKRRHIDISGLSASHGSGCQQSAPKKPQHSIDASKAPRIAQTSRGGSHSPESAQMGQGAGLVHRLTTQGVVSNACTGFNRESTGTAEDRDTPLLTVQRYTPADDELLIRLRSQGKRWKEIARLFPDRSKNSLQAHWQAKLKYKTDRHPSRIGITHQAQSRNYMQQRLEQKVAHKHNVPDAGANDKTPDLQPAENLCEVNPQRRNEVPNSSSSAGETHALVSNTSHCVTNTPHKEPQDLAEQRPERWHESGSRNCAMRISEKSPLMISIHSKSQTKSVQDHVADCHSSPGKDNSSARPSSQAACDCVLTRNEQVHDLLPEAQGGPAEQPDTSISLSSHSPDVPTLISYSADHTMGTKSVTEKSDKIAGEGAKSENPSWPRQGQFYNGFTIRYLVLQAYAAYSHGEPLTLAQIFEAIEKTHFDLGKHRPTWKASVTTCLSVYPEFQRVDRGLWLLRKDSNRDIDPQAQGKAETPDFGHTVSALENPAKPLTTNDLDHSFTTNGQGQTARNEEITSERASTAPLRAALQAHIRFDELSSHLGRSHKANISLSELLQKSPPRESTRPVRPLANVSSKRAEQPPRSTDNIKAFSTTSTSIVPLWHPQVEHLSYGDHQERLVQLFGTSVTRSGMKHLAQAQDPAAGEMAKAMPKPSSVTPLDAMPVPGPETVSSRLPIQLLEAQTEKLSTTGSGQIPVSGPLSIKTRANAGAERVIKMVNPPFRSPLTSASARLREKRAPLIPNATSMSPSMDLKAVPSKCTSELHALVSGGVLTVVQDGEGQPAGGSETTLVGCEPVADDDPSFAHGKSVGHVAIADSRKQRHSTGSVPPRSAEADRRSCAPGPMTAEKRKSLGWMVSTAAVEMRTPTKHLRRSIALGYGTRRIVETPIKVLDESEDELG